MAVGWIKGAQAQGVIADVKHFAANNQEGIAGGQRRRPGQPLGPPPTRATGCSSTRRRRADAARDLPAAVRGGGQGGARRLGDVLLQPAQRRRTRARTTTLLEDILERDWGFKGFVLADYGAAHDTAGVAQQRARLRAVAAASRYGPTAGQAPRSPTGQATQAHGRRARAPHPAHAVRLRLLRPRRLPRRRRADRQAPRTRATAQRHRGAGDHAAAQPRRRAAARRARS